MSRAVRSTSWCTKVVVLGLLTGGLTTMGGGTATARGGHPLSVGTDYPSQVWTGVVPAGVCSVRAEVVGGEGGSADYASGGLAGEVQARVAVTPGEIVTVSVGAAGGGVGPRAAIRAGARVHPDSPLVGGLGGVSGGAPSGGDGGARILPGAGGGGATTVTFGSASSPSIIAGGGGGAAWSTGHNIVGGDGGDGGLVGHSGGAGTGSTDPGGTENNVPAQDGQGGGGASGTTVGTGGAAGTNPAGLAGSAGSGALGGAGGGGLEPGIRPASPQETSGTGGGGGGGYAGGGGGGSAGLVDEAFAAGGGGGGGSNLAPEDAIFDGVTANTGNGFASFEVMNDSCPPSLPSAARSVRATAGNRTATVTWTAPDRAGDVPITGYLVTAYVGGVAGGSFASPGPGRTLKLPPVLTNGVHYRFTVTAVTGSGNGVESAKSNLVTPMAPVVPLAVTSQTLWGHIEIARHTTRIPFTITLNQPRPSLEVELVAAATGEVLASTDIAPALPGVLFSGEVRFSGQRIRSWGPYTWILKTGAPSSTFILRSDLRRHSVLSLGATRHGALVTVTGSAKVFAVAADTYRGWAGRKVDVQELTTSGWVTVATAMTDARGHLRTTVKLAGQVTLRLVDSDSPTQFGRVSTSRTV